MRGNIAVTIRQLAAKGESIEGLFRPTDGYDIGSGGFGKIYQVVKDLLRLFSLNVKL